MFKKDLYTEVIRVLNLNTQSQTFQGGYLIGIYDGQPYIQEASTLNPFDYVNSEVVPVSEEIAQETPSVNLADRSDYIFQYKIMFKSVKEDEVLESLDEFRTYFFTNKQVAIDGYTVSIKTSRGDKQGNILVQTGDFYSFYTIKVFATAIKNGYIWKDADNWKVRLYATAAIDAGDFLVGATYKIVATGNTDFETIGADADFEVGTIFTATGVGTGTGTASQEYETLILDSETFATSGNPLFSNATDKGLGVISLTTVAAKLTIFYSEQFMEDKVYSWIMNDLELDTVFQFVHTFNGSTFTYEAYIVGGVRTRKDNATTILEFDWIEADI